jgi:hypothetical protein
MSKPQYYHRKIGWRDYPEEHKMAQMGISTRPPEVVPTQFTPLPSFKCNYCDASFGAPGTLQHHIESNHAHKNSESESYEESEPDFGDYNGIISAQVSMGKTREEAWQTVKNFHEYTRDDFEHAYDDSVMMEIVTSTHTGKPLKIPIEEQQKMAQKMLDMRED